jgi:hypothetical protein
MIKSVVEENKRQKQMVLFGAPDESASDLGNTIDEVLQHVCGEVKPIVKDYCRVGTLKSGKNRPMKVCFKSSEEAHTTIRRANSLKTSAKYEKVFIAPDRSPAERAQGRKLVQPLRGERHKAVPRH